MTENASTENASKVIMPLLLMQQMSQTAGHTDMLVYQGTTLAKLDLLQDYDDSPDEQDRGPGRGNSRTGTKALYARRESASLYENIRIKDTDFGLFEKTVHLTRAEFDDLFGVVAAEMGKAMDVRAEHGEQHRIARRRRLDSREMLFLFMDVLGGSNEGGIGIERVAYRYGVSTGTVSNYFRHVLYSLYRCLDAMEPRLVSWPTHQERKDVEGLVIGFPLCVFFVDGNKNKRWRPGQDKEQERAYDGYKKAHAWSLLVFCDLFGRFIRVEISDKGAESDRNLYTNSDVYRNPNEFLSGGQHGMADMGFAGAGALVVPYKQNESTSWMYRAMHNRYIRRQRMVNEWGIGYINNRYRLFLGRWPFEKELFAIAYTTAAMLSNWQFDRRGYALQPRQRYEEKLEAHLNLDDSE